MSTIYSIESFVVPYTEPNDHGSTRYVCLVKITDSDGVVGWGEAVTLFREATVATHALIGAYRDLVVGKPANPSTILNALLAHGWWFADAGLASFALSSIDLALWDIAAKRAAQSLANLLGRAQTRLPIFVSCHAAQADISAMTDSMAEKVSDVCATGIKIGFGKRGDARLGYDHDRDVSFIRELRKRLGDDSHIMIDIGATITWSVDDAISRIRAFEEYGVYWTEEPLGAHNPDGYRRLKKAVSSMIAYGEREWNMAGYASIIESGTVDVVGIDPGRAQGITGFLATSRLLEKQGVQGNAHAFAGPLVFAASLALSQNTLACRQLELMPLRNSLYELVENCPAPLSGTLSSSEEHGIGVTIIEKRVRAVAESTA